MSESFYLKIGEALRSVSEIKETSDFPLFTILRDDSRFAYDLLLKTIFLPDIYAITRIFEEEGIEDEGWEGVTEDEDLTAFKSGNIEWVIFGINHEYLHFILHQLVGSEASTRMDFLKVEEFL